MLCFLRRGWSGAARRRLCGRRATAARPFSSVFRPSGMRAQGGRPGCPKLWLLQRMARCGRAGMARRYGGRASSFGSLRRLRNHIGNVRDTPEPWCGSAAMISCRFGFCDHAQFSRLFGAGFDLTPSAWRKLWVQARLQVPRSACDHPRRFHYPARGLEYRKPCGQSAAIGRRRGDAAGWRVRRNGRQGAGRA